VSAASQVRLHAAATFRSLQDAIAPLGSPSALSLRVGLIVFPLGMLATLIGEMPAHEGHPVPWAVAAAIGQVALLAVLLIARRVLCRSGDPRPFAVLAAFVVAGAARSLTVGPLIVLLDGVEEIDLGYRLAGLTFNAVLLGVTAWAVSLHDRHHAVVTELERVRRRTASLERSLDAELARTEAELSGAVRASVSPALRAVDAALAQVAAGTSGQRPVLADLERLIDDEVRPLSHRLASEEVHPPPLDPVSEASLAVRVPLPRAMPVAAGFRPLFTATGFLVAAIPSAVRDLEPVLIPIYLLAVWAWIWVACRAARSLARGAVLPIPIAAVLVVGLHGLLVAVLPFLLRAAGLPFPDGLPPLSVALAGAFVGVLLVIAHLVTARRAATEAELVAVNERLASSVALIRRRRALVRRRLAFVLHGSLQGALHAAAIRLREVETVDGAVVAAIRGEIAAAFARLEPDRTATGILRTRATIDEIVAVWEGMRTVEVRVEGEAEAGLSGDPDADLAAAEVIREAVNNAIRHGGARTIEIRVATTSPEVLAVSVRDDGGGLQPAGRSGLGSALYDDLCRTWSLEETGPGTLFRAEIGIA